MFIEHISSRPKIKSHLSARGKTKMALLPVLCLNIDLEEDYQQSTCLKKGEGSFILKRNAMFMYDRVTKNVQLQPVMLDLEFTGFGRHFEFLHH